MRKPIILTAIVMLFCAASLQAGEPASDRDFSKAITQVRLEVPADPGVRSSLGIKAKSGQMTLADIDADIILIEIFSFYCPFCQKHAPMTRALHQEIETGKDTRGKVKLIGIGVGNSPFEVDKFRKKYGIGFPLFADPSSAVLNSLTGIRTPYYFAIRRKGASLNVFFTQQGAFDDAQAFLRTVLEKSKQP